MWAVCVTNRATLSLPCLTYVLLVDRVCIYALMSNGWCVDDLRLCAFIRRGCNLSTLPTTSDEDGVHV